MSITDFLVSRGFSTFEGHCQEVPKQVDDLIRLTSGSGIHLMEIGFNGGHSSHVFLKMNPSLSVTSFDLGIHDYVLTAKQFIDTTYPGRHTLLVGDSTVSVPKYSNHNPNKTFDVIFIDGGHEYETASADLENCRKLATKDTIVIMDDTIYTKGQNTPVGGPAQAWMKQVEKGRIVELNRVEYSSDRGMSWGNYV
jgi:predicted O-methyltransferase YrrM